MQILLILAAFFGATGVALGAFGAHGLASVFEANGRLETFRTATLYHLIHAVAIFGVALLLRDTDTNVMQWAGYLMAAGILFFSGSLYILSIFDIRMMGAVAPIGGIAFIFAWVLLGVGAISLQTTVVS